MRNNVIFYLQTSDYVSRILTPSTPSPASTRTSISSSTGSEAKYNCQFCNFNTNRLNVIVLHSKNHTNDKAGSSKSNLIHIYSSFHLLYILSNNQNQQINQLQLLQNDLHHHLPKYSQLDFNEIAMTLSKIHL